MYFTIWIYTKIPSQNVQKSAIFNAYQHIFEVFWTYMKKVFSNVHEIPGFVDILNILFSICPISPEKTEYWPDMFIFLDISV